MSRRYGLKEVANVTFFDVEDGKPKLFFDTLKVSTIENESESAEARGGQGNAKLLSWDYGRTANLTLQDALLSDTSLAMLAGTEVVTDNIKVAGREIVTLGTLGEITLKEEAVGGNGAVHVYLYENGLLGEELPVDSVDGEEVTVTGGAEGKEAMVFYEYMVTTGASKVTFSGDKFPATYKVIGDTYGRGEDGVDRMMQFVIPKAKLQSSFSLTMDVENVSVFDFNLEVLADGAEKELYQIIHLP